MPLHGQCHCGNLTLELDLGGEPDRIPARRCSCSFCTAHGCLWTSAVHGRLRLHASDAGKLSRYRFGTATADFLLCAACGVVVACTSDIDGKLHAVVNLAAIRDVDPARFDRATVNFDGEAVADRLSRRQRYWIGDVAILA